MQHKAVLCLWLIACWAWAQEVVVLEFQADPQMRLSSQVESAVWEHTTLRPLPLQTYMREASRTGVVNAQTAAGFSRVAAHVQGVVIAVWGKVEGSHVEIFIWDKAGAQLWTRRLPLKQGLLTQELSQRLARAIVVAVEFQTKGEVSKEKPEDKVHEVPFVPVPLPEEPVHPLQRTEPALPEGGVDEEGAPEVLEVDTKPEPFARQTPFLRMAVQGTASWRSVCLRPGRDSCIALDELPEEPQGSRDFSSGAYAGAFLQAEYFPLALWTPSVWRGLGLRMEAGYGRARKDFVDAGPSALPLTLAMQEIHWSAEALYRHFFLTPSSDGMGLHASLSLGYAGKNFLSEDVFESGLVPPDLRRRFLRVGADTELSLSFIRFGLYADVWIQPKPIQHYGNARSQGYRVGGAVSGMIYGPLGYKVDVSWTFFKDTFADDVFPTGGMMHESYLSLKGGLLLEF